MCLTRIKLLDLKRFIAKFGTVFRKERHCFPTVYFTTQTTDRAELNSTYMLTFIKGNKLPFSTSLTFHQCLN
jgi:hypothetical protein